MRAIPPKRRRLRDRRGIAAVEFALVAPVLLLVVFTMYDLGEAMWRTTRLELAARAGAQYAFAKPLDEAGIAARVRGQLEGLEDVTIAPTAMVCRCDDGAEADCTTGTCPAGAGTQAPIGYISITVTQPFSHVSPISAAILPGLSTLRGNVELRVH